MALKGVAGPDRVLYGLSALLQNKFPSRAASLSQPISETLLVFPDSTLVLDTDFDFIYEVNGVSYTVRFIAGRYSYQNIITTINDAAQPLRADKFSTFGIILSCDSSVKFLTEFGSIRKNQISNNRNVLTPKTFIVSGVLPRENELKSFPACVINLASVQPSADTIVCKYNVIISLGITSPISSSQVDYMSKQLMDYYDIIRDIILVDDDGSLGMLTNGVVINSANIQDATGASNFLKILNISLTVSVEED